MTRREILRYTALATGAAVSAPFATAFLGSGCQAEPPVEPYAPQFFTQEQYDFIVKFADTVIPPTDTPGASDVGVPQVIDELVGVIYPPEEREAMQAGLVKLMARIDGDQADEVNFAGLDTEAALVYLQDQDLHYKDPLTEWPETPEGEVSARDAYFGLKGMVIANYFGSKEVAMNQLAYLPIPGEYVPCGDLQELTGGKAWAAI